MDMQKQSLKDILAKMCSENIEEIYSRTLVRKDNFNKVALQLYWNYTFAWVLSSISAAYFQNTVL